MKYLGLFETIDNTDIENYFIDFTDSGWQKLGFFGKYYISSHLYKESPNKNIIEYETSEERFEELILRMQEGGLIVNRVTLTIVLYLEREGVAYYAKNEIVKYKVKNNGDFIKVKDFNIANFLLKNSDCKLRIDMCIGYDMKYVKTFEAYVNMGSPLLKLKDNVDHHLTNVIESVTPTGSKILEISCGNGSDAIYLKDKGFNITCTELNDGYCDNAISLGLKCVKHDTLDKFPFRDKEFELTYSRLGLHYFNELELTNILKEIDRISKYILITVKVENTESTGKIILNEEKWRELISQKFNIKRFKIRSGILYGIQSTWLEVLAKSKQSFR